MPLKPLPQDELDEMKVLPEGIYDFEVIKAEETTSKKGNDMIEVCLRVFHEDRTVLVNDWLVGAEHYLCQHKIRTFCDTCGIEQADEHCVGACGKVKLEIEDDEKYGRQNRVGGYYTGDGSELGQKREKVPDVPPNNMPLGDDQEIPF